MTGEERVVYLHVGTHKTGTTSIQAMLAMNEGALARNGLLVPRAGRPAQRWGTWNCGHHNVAWELGGLAEYRPQEGGFEDLVREIEAARPAAAVVSSEDFQWLRDKPAVLERVRDRFERAGYAVAIVVYVRRQPEYFQAIYTENAKAGFPINFEAMLNATMRDGYWRIEHPPAICSVDYAPMVESFAAVFGRERMLVRPYAPGRNPGTLLREFLATVGAERVPFDALLRPAVRNPSPTMRQVLAGLSATARLRMPGAAAPETIVAQALPAEDLPLLDEKFDVMRRDELIGLLERCAAGNAELAQSYGAAPPSAGDERPCFAASWDAVEKQRHLLDAAQRAWAILAETK